MRRLIIVVRLTVVAVLALPATVPCVAEAQPPIAPASVAADIQAVIAQSPASSVAGQPVASSELRMVYAATGSAPLWQLEPRADMRRQSLEAALLAAADQGMRTDGLHVDALTRLARPATARNVAERDVLLTDALLRYARKLRLGAVSVEALGADWHIAPQSFDAARALIEALRGGKFDEFLQSLPPASPQYRLLADALQHYRAIARRGGWAAIPGRDEVKLDGRDPRMSMLSRRLLAEGYLSASAQGPGDIALAVRQFQATHGLEGDARVGQKTLAELNVSADQRVDQIAANLERWRHLPHALGTRYVAVNVADASLDLIENGASQFHTRVIVGDMRHPTPTIQANITAVTFNPPWKVPMSIAVKEMLPRLRRDPGYLAANDIVIVGRPDDPFGRRVDWRRISPQNFPFRFQQQPGLKNSLGALKLEMANQWNVYLHDTPAKTLFARPNRGFSHGCVRVQQPPRLAQLLLDDSWDAVAIADGMASGVTRSVPLPRPVPVYLLYMTAFVDAEGTVNFRDDIYGRDPAIERALGLDHGSTVNQLPHVAACGEPPGGLGLEANG